MLSAAENVLRGIVASCAEGTPPERPLIETLLCWQANSAAAKPRTDFTTRRSVPA
jgi:hypothetical protein